MARPVRGLHFWQIKVLDTLKKKSHAWRSSHGWPVQQLQWLQKGTGWIVYVAQKDVDNKNREKPVSQVLGCRQIATGQHFTTASNILDRVRANHNRGWVAIGCDLAAFLLSEATVALIGLPRLQTRAILALNQPLCNGSSIPALALSPNEVWLCIYWRLSSRMLEGHDGVIKVYDTRNGHEVCSLALSGHSNDMSWSPTSDMVTSRSDGELLILKVPSGACINVPVFPTNICNQSFRTVGGYQLWSWLPDGQRLVVHGQLQGSAADEELASSFHAVLCDGTVLCSWCLASDGTLPNDSSPLHCFSPLWSAGLQGSLQPCDTQLITAFQKLNVCHALCLGNLPIANLSPCGRMLIEVKDTVPEAAAGPAPLAQTYWSGPDWRKVSQVTGLSAGTWVQRGRNLLVAWHLLPALSHVYAIITFTGYLAIVDGRTAAVLHRYTFPEPMSWWHAFHQALHWSPDGTKLFVTGTYKYYVLSYGSQEQGMQQKMSRARTAPWRCCW